MEPLTFRHPQRITYAECTVGNHVYYARYLDLLEAARGEFFRSLGQPLLELQREGVIFPVTECHVRYLQPARYDEVVTTELWLTLARGARLNFGCRMRGEAGGVILEGETFHACATLEEKPKRIPEDLLLKLQPFVQSPAP